MKLKLTLAAILLLGIITYTAYTATDAVWSVDGWIITSSYTNPNPTEGTAVGTLEGTITYQHESSALPQTATETVTLLAGKSTIKKVWTSKTALNAGYIIANVTGDGTAVFDSTGKLVYTISAPNDGQPHVISFKLKPTGVSWLARIPLLRNFTAPEV